MDCHKSCDHNNNNNREDQNCPENNHSCMEVLQARLIEKEQMVSMLEDKLKLQDQAQDVLTDLQILLENLQQTIDDVTESHQESYDNICRNLDKVTTKYEQILTIKDQLKQDNDQLQCCIDSKTSKKCEKVYQIEKLETLKSENLKCINVLEKKIKIEQECIKELEKLEMNANKALNNEASTAHMLGDELITLEAVIRHKQVQMAEKQRINDDLERKLNNLKTQHKEREEELVALDQAGKERLAQVDRAVAEARAQLAEGCAELADWEDKFECTAKAYHELKAASEEEACRDQTEVSEQIAERKRLDEQLSNASGQLCAVETEHRRLVADITAADEKVACLKAEMTREEQRVLYERLSFSLYQTMCETELMLLVEENKVKSFQLYLAENELEELRRDEDQRDEAIRKVEEKLDYC